MRASVISKRSSPPKGDECERSLISQYFEISRRCALRVADNMKLLEYKTGYSMVAFSTMRGEGYGNYGGFNITGYCGDCPAHVAECRKQLCKKLGIEDHRLLLPRQTHGDKVLVIDELFMQKPAEEQSKLLHDIDAVVTELKRTCIGVSTADCIPILMYDNRRGVVAAAHAGWRGTVARIAEKTVATMTDSYGCRPEEIKAIIGPGISLDSFEVGNEVYNTFNESCFPMEKIAKLYPTAGGGSKWHIDLWEANRLQLIASGIPEENISVAGICSYREHERFFSARRLGIESGRIFSGIMLI